MRDEKLHIELFGEFNLKYERKVLKSIKSSRAEELLAYLLIHRHSPQTRSYLAFKLWPESSEKQARTNLRNLIYKVRKVLPEPDSYLIINNKSFQWNTEATCTLDVANFSDCVHKAKTHHSDNRLKDGIAQLQRATEFYKDDFLISFYKRWLEPKRAQFKQKYTWLLKTLLQILESPRKYREAIPHANKLINCDEFDEASYRLLIRLYALCNIRPKP